MILYLLSNRGTQRNIVNTWHYTRYCNCMLTLMVFVFCIRGSVAVDGAGLGIDRPAELSKSDDEYDAFRKRMMLAYRFRPNPLVILACLCKCLCNQYILYWKQ